MSRRGRHRRTAGQELRSFMIALVFVAVAYVFFASGLFASLMSVPAQWYAEQAIERLEGRTSPAPTRS